MHPGAMIQQRGLISRTNSYAALPCTAKGHMVSVISSEFTVQLDSDVKPDLNKARFEEGKHHSLEVWVMHPRPAEDLETGQVRLAQRHNLSHR